MNEPAPSKSQQKQLAAFIQAVMNTPPSDLKLSEASSVLGSRALQVVGQDYHLEFYQQLPELVLSILNDGPDGPELVNRYGALLFHLAGCMVCHQAYMELYNSLSAALSQPTSLAKREPADDSRPLRALPPVMREHFCRLLISQAEALLCQNLPEQGAARQLLQTAIRVGGTIDQAMVKQQALGDLVRVASLAEPQTHEMQAPFFYTLAMPQGALRSGAPTVESEIGQESTIIVRCGQHLGHITQEERVLFLHLQDLDVQMRGHILLVSFPLGTLFEPVWWYQHPNAMIIPATLSESGVRLPLGETDLRIGDPAEKSLLEILFLRFEVRLVDSNETGSSPLLTPPSHPS